MRLIDADALDDVIQILNEKNWGITRGDYKLIDAVLFEFPTIEERKKGKWTPKENRPKQEVFICSECGGGAYSPWIGSRKTPKPNKCKYSYCPNCGADMRGDKHETD